MEMEIKPPLLTQIEQAMKDKNPNDYKLLFNNEDLAFIFSREPINGTIMESIHNVFLPEGKVFIIEKTKSLYDITSFKDHLLN